MIVYFTGTGNSRYCAQLLASRLGDQTTDVFPFIRSGTGASLSSDTPWVFAAPTYSWQLPRVFADFIRQSSFSGSKDAWFVMTCGSDVGNAAPSVEGLCREKGFRFRGILPVVMPENYLAMFPVPDADESRAIIQAARPVLEEGAALIRQDRDFPPVETGFLDHLKSGVVNTLFYRFNVKDKAFTVSSLCVSCGKCEKLCPLGNIRMENGKPRWNGRCTHCMACICGCPTEAIQYGRASAGKPRYQCPPYEG